jgi:uncharacterized sodium:solute symporter family permease YidK
MNEKVEIITKLLKALLPVAAALGYTVTPDQIEAISYVIGGLLTLIYSLEAFGKFKRQGGNQ